MHYIDLRSDTVTKPTPEMREAMASAEVGDDVYGEDPTVNKLEQLAAEMVGKEAALFVASGTMGNQVAVMTHTRRGDEVILETESHIYYYEVGALAVLSGVQARPIKGYLGAMDPEEVRSSIRSNNVHFPRTSLVCVENTHNRAGGTVLPLENLKGIYQVAKESGLAVHMDGARLFNAATALKIPAKQIACYCDSVMFCLSKGLCAPVGSILAGSRDWIEKARKNRKMLGGGMRQAGILAAAGIVALTKMVSRLEEDHQNARLLAEGLSCIPGLHVDINRVQTNMVMVDVAGLGVTADAVSLALLERGVKVNPMGPTTLRFVTHHDVTRQDCERAVKIVQEVAYKFGKP
ncbi:MAG: low-specificity L-threonine aldolase [Bacillota bacterium]